MASLFTGTMADAQGDTGTEIKNDAEKDPGKDTHPNVDKSSEEAADEKEAENDTKEEANREVEGSKEAGKDSRKTAGQNPGGDADSKAERDEEKDTTRDTQLNEEWDIVEDVESVPPPAGADDPLNVIEKTKQEIESYGLHVPKVRPLTLVCTFTVPAINRLTHSARSLSIPTENSSLNLSITS